MQEPQLKAMPGRVVVKMVPRVEKIPGSNLTCDSKYFYQPFLGTIVDIGKPLTETQEIIATELKTRDASGERFIFTHGNGIDYATSEMLDVKGNRTDENGQKIDRFGYLGHLRVFRIEDFGASLVGGDELGGSNE